MKVTKEMVKRKMLVVARAMNDAKPDRNGVIRITSEGRDEIVSSLYLLCAPDWAWEARDEV